MRYPNFLMVRVVIPARYDTFLNLDEGWGFRLDPPPRLSWFAVHQIHRERGRRWPQLRSRSSRPPDERSSLKRWDLEEGAARAAQRAARRLAYVYEGPAHFLLGAPVWGAAGLVAGLVGRVSCSLLGPDDDHPLPSQEWRLEADAKMLATKKRWPTPFWAKGAHSWPSPARPWISVGGEWAPGATLEILNRDELAELIAEVGRAR